MNITLYSTGCPQCKVLKAKLDQAGISYTLINDQDIMAAKGFRSAPILEVNDTTYTFADAVKWVRGQVNGD